MPGPYAPVEAEPPQTVENPVHHRIRGSLDVSVFDPQDEDAAVPAGEQPVEERGACAANVEVAGRRGSETNARRRHL